MSTNKHAIIRYQALDKCFRNPGRKYFIEDLVEACCKAISDFSGIDSGIKRRQVLDDIKFMESSQGWSIPLLRLRDGHRVYFKYQDTGYSINNQPLNEMEENQLKEALLTLSRFKGMPQFEWVDEIAARLNEGLGLSHAKDKIIDFDQNNYLKGLEFITPIYNAILYKKTLSIEYKSFKQDAPQAIIFYCYFLKQYNNRWYVFGKQEAVESLMNLALDRILSITESRNKYIPNKGIDFSDYFDDIVGVTLDPRGKMEKVVLKVSSELLPYIVTKPIHGSQKIKEKGLSHTFITLDVIPNYELESVILSFGDGLEVIQPKSFREKIKSRIQFSLSEYNNNADRLHS